ncbi:MAG: ParM/StbA family protein [Balneolaceae bacterium]
MRIRTISFPSLIQSQGPELVNVARNQLTGLKIQEDDQDYIVGELALSEGKSPHKAMNNSVDELEYKLLSKSAVLTASNHIKEPMVITTGFPYSTINLNKQAAVDYLTSLESITYDAKTYGGNGHVVQPVQINRVEVIPELIGGIIAMRRGEEKRNGNFFLVSLGYGTVEIGLSTDKGVIQRTEGTASGMRYAVDWAMRSLMKKYYVGLRTEQQFDVAFQAGNIILNRKRIDLTDLRKEALKHYYKDVISPLMRNTWTDDDFNRSNTIILIGGGAHFPELVENFKEEFDGFVNIEVAPNPATVSSRGYCIRSADISGSHDAAVGIDIGNANTSISVFEGDQESDESISY